MLVPYALTSVKDEPLSVAVVPPPPQAERKIDEMVKVNSVIIFFIVVPLIDMKRMCFFTVIPYLFLY